MPPPPLDLFLILLTHERPPFLHVYLQPPEPVLQSCSTLELNVGFPKNNENLETNVEKLFRLYLNPYMQYCNPQLFPDCLSIKNMFIISELSSRQKLNSTFYTSGVIKVSSFVGNTVKME